MFTPNHWHQTFVCYQATRVWYPIKRPKKWPIIYHVILMTLIMVHRLKKTMTVSSSQKLS